MKTNREIYLEVGHGHSIFVQTFGQPDGTPIIFLHGGPGLGCSIKDQRFFNPEKHFVIFLDQRGSGKSTPLGGIDHNTTDDLVDDILKVLDHFDIEKIHLFGGSWGSALALIFSIRYPEKVISMILRGVFLGDRATIDLMLQGGLKNKFPAVWEKFISTIPEKNRSEIASFLLEKLTAPNTDESDKYLKAWIEYETRCVMPDVSKDALKKIFNVPGQKEDATIFMHYSVNYCFLPDGFVMDHTDLIAHIPIQIIHGDQDFICPADKIIALATQLPLANLHLLSAGHLASDPKIEAALIAAVDQI